MMTVGDFYEGGMILFDVNTAYDYENFLAALIKRRIKKYEFGKKRKLFSSMWEAFELKGKHWEKSRFYVMPGDPLVYIPACPRWMLLKGKWLNILEYEVFKIWRRRGYGRNRKGAEK